MTCTPADYMQGVKCLSKRNVCALIMERLVRNFAFSLQMDDFEYKLWGLTYSTVWHKFILYS